jgi:hypothetical protein
LIGGKEERKTKEAYKTAKSSVNDKHEGENYCRDKIFWLKSLTANRSLLNYSNRSFLDIHGVSGE